MSDPVEFGGWPRPPRWVWVVAGVAVVAALLASVSEGNHGELLAWRQGMPGPALVTSLPGPLVEAPPLLPG